MKIYKYKDLTDPSNLNHVLDIFHNEIWCSSPERFDDPDEFRFEIDYSRTTRSTIDILRQILIKLKNEPGDGLRQLSENTSDAVLQSIVKGNAIPIFDDVINKCRSSIGVACFSLSGNEDVLWNDYGGKKNGVCIEIEISDKWLDKSLFLVNYVRQKIFHIDHFLSAVLNDTLKIYRMILATKSDKWAYQKEIRFLSTKQNLLVPFNAKITGIWFGRHLSSDLKKRIMDEIGDVSPNRLNLQTQLTEKELIMPDPPRTGFEEQGFLSTEIGDTIQHISTKYSEWLQFFYEINYFAQHIQYQLEVHIDNPQELVVATLFSRTLANIQAAIILCIRGMDAQTQIMLRCSLECLFSLTATSLNPGLAKDFINADLLERKKIYYKIKQWPEHLKRKNDVHDQEIDEKLKEIQDEIAKLGVKKIHIEEMAKKAEMHEWYVTAYPIYSDPVHSSIRSMENGHMVQIEELKNEPALEELEPLFMMGIQILLEALSAIDRVFGPGKIIVNEHKNTLRELSEKYNLI
ncbi:MAG: DUF5677 domain-containing protein [Candidatus Kryptoniota bacterium]